MAARPSNSPRGGGRVKGERSEPEGTLDTSVPGDNPRPANPKRTEGRGRYPRPTRPILATAGLLPPVIQGESQAKGATGVRFSSSDPDRAKGLELVYPGTYVRESQPDWLTVGAHRRATVNRLSDLATALQVSERNDGNQHRPWRLLGYEGFRCGRVRFGEARGWGLMQLSGDMARAWLKPALECADSVSRFDVAVTVSTDRPDPDLGRRVFEQATAWRADHPKAAASWYVGGDNTGWTTYIGQRQSDWFCRVYNKDAEVRAGGDSEQLRQYENAWRYELEIKGDPAEQAARRLAESSDLHHASMSLVSGWLSPRGVSVPWDDDRDVRPLGTFRRRSDRERKLEWLLQQVKPTVKWLVENGDSPAAIAALGLTDYLQPRSTGA